MQTHKYIHNIWETKKQSSAKSTSIGCSSPGTNCLHTLEAGTLRKVGVSHHGSPETKDRVAQRCWSHALLKSMHI